MPLMKAKSFWFSKLKKLKNTDIPLSNLTINYKGKNQINFQHKPATATKNYLFKLYKRKTSEQVSIQGKNSSRSPYLWGQANLAD